MESALEQTLRRQRLITIGALVLLILLAWGSLLLGAGTGMKPHASLLPFSREPVHMSAMAMGSSGEERDVLSGLRHAVTFLMWWIMMVAMMLPSASSTMLLYARSTRHTGLHPATGNFLAGYLGVWAAFSLAATMLQAGLEGTGLLSPLMASQNRWLSGAILIAAGLYQFTPLKDLCLRHCRNPAWFLSRNFRPGVLGAARMGAHHGTYCVGCCWPLMTLLFVGGVMNLLWIALLTLLVAAEKLLPFGRQVSMASGLGCLTGGAALLVS